MSRKELIWAMAGLAFIVGLFAWGVIALNAAEGQSQQRADDWHRDPTNPINVCIAKGGVPITSAWDGRLKDCQFKPTKEHS